VAVQYFSLKLELDNKLYFNGWCKNGSTKEIMNNGLNDCISYKLVYK